MASLFVFVLFLNFMCQAVDVAEALPIPQRASLPHWEAPRVALEIRFQSLFTTGERPRASIHPHVSLTSLDSSTVLHFGSIHDDGIL
jgi:hypothetical protein